jgi:hypothetical protein
MQAPSLEGGDGDISAVNLSAPGFSVAVGDFCPRLPRLPEGLMA